MGSGGTVQWGASNSEPSSSGYSDSSSRSGPSASQVRHAQAEAANNQGIAAGLRGDNQSSAQYYQEALRLEPTNRIYRANMEGALGCVATKNNDMESALHHLLEAQRLNPENPSNKANLAHVRGMLAYRKRDWASAISYWEDALHRARALGWSSGDIATIRANIAEAQGAIAEGRGDLKSAMRFFQEAVKYEPNSNYQAEVSRVKRKIEEREEQKAEELKRQKDEETARLAKEKKEVKEKEEVKARVLEANAAGRKVYDTDPKAAITYFEKAIKLDPNNSFIKEELLAAKIHDAVNEGKKLINTDPKAAVVYLKAAAELDPSDSGLKENVKKGEAAVEYSNGNSLMDTDPKAALEAFKKAYEFMPDEGILKSMKLAEFLVKEQEEAKQASTAQGKKAGTASEQLTSTALDSNKARELITNGNPSLSTNGSYDAAAKKAQKGFDAPNDEHARGLDPVKITGSTTISPGHPEISDVPKQYRNNEKVMHYDTEAREWAVKVDKINQDIAKLEQDTSNKGTDRWNRQVKLAEKRSEKSIAQSNVDAAEINKKEAIKFIDTQIKK